VANHSLRSAIVLILLFGTFALAVPAVSKKVDSWLFSEGDEPSPWSSQPAAETTPPQAEEEENFPYFRPDSPGVMRGKIPPLTNQNTAPRELPAFAMQPNPDLDFVFPPEAFASGVPQGRGSVEGPVALAQYESEEQARLPDERLIKQQFESLGASYVVVEELEPGRFECRCLVPLSAESSYQKAFSAVGSSQAAAIEQVLAEVRAWQRASAAHRSGR
jgi:hypothetical protein